MPAPRIDPESGLIIVESDADVPVFATEEEEAEFWGTHTFSDKMLEEFGEAPDWLQRS